METERKRGDGILQRVYTGVDGAYVCIYDQLGMKSLKLHFDLHLVMKVCEDSVGRRSGLHFLKCRAFLLCNLYSIEGDYHLDQQTVVLLGDAESLLFVACRRKNNLMIQPTPCQCCQSCA